MSALRSLKFVLDHPVNRGRPIEALWRVAKWQVGARLHAGPVVFDWIDGARFLVRKGEAGLTGNVYCGLHEFAEMAYVLHVLEPGDCFVDVGANVGSYTILACAVRKARGYCFEPVPATFERLMANLRLNGLAERVNAYNCGVSDAPGELWFSTGEDCTNHVVEGPAEDPHATLVKTVTLDSALEGASANVIKIDVEGLESRVLEGAHSVLANPSLHSVVMEINGSGARYGFSDDALVATMARFGFRECAYDPFERAIRPATASQRSGNSLFVRDESRVASRLRDAPRIAVFGLEI